MILINILIYLLILHNYLLNKGDILFVKAKIIIGFPYFFNSEMIGIIGEDDYLKRVSLWCWNPRKCFWILAEIKYVRSKCISRFCLPISLRVYNLFPISYWMHSPEGNPISQQLLTSSNPNRTFLPPAITTNATTNKLLSYFPNIQ